MEAVGDIVVVVVVGGGVSLSFGISGTAQASAADVELYVDMGRELQQLVLDEPELSVTGAVCSEGHLTALSPSSGEPLSLAVLLSYMSVGVAVVVGVAAVAMAVMHGEVVAVGSAGSTACGSGRSSDLGDSSVNVSSTMISLASCGL